MLSSVNLCEYIIYWLLYFMLTDQYIYTLVSRKCTHSYNVQLENMNVLFNIYESFWNYT